MRSDLPCISLKLRRGETVLRCWWIVPLLVMLLTLSTSLLIVVNLLIPTAILIFAGGFFPYKPFLPGRSHYHGGDIEKVPDPPFDKVIFMIVDALRRYD